MLEVTQVRVRKCNKEVGAERKDRIIARVSITLNNCFAIHDIKVIDKHDGKRLVAMPSRRGGDGRWHDVAHPINKETRALIEGAVLTQLEQTPDPIEISPAPATDVAQETAATPAE